MIKLSNGHSFEYMIASGGLEFDGRGWPWEKPMVNLGLIRPELFTVVTKSLSLNPIKGNLSLLHPWTCVKLIPGGAVNKVGLTNKGIKWWLHEVAPYINFQKYQIIVSLYGTAAELIEMVQMLHILPIYGIELNVSCPNSGHKMDEATVIVKTVKELSGLTAHPLLIKVSVAQDYLAIAKGLVGVAQAMSFNSVPWSIAFPNRRSPLYKLEKRVGGGGGGVSGKPAQPHNWPAVQVVSLQTAMPVIGPDIMEFGDMDKVEELGAQAKSFGTIHLPTAWLMPWTLFTNPLKPTQFVIKELAKKIEREVSYANK